MGHLDAWESIKCMYNLETKKNMKKKIIGAIVVAIAAIAVFNMSLNTENNELSTLTLNNVEALAAGEIEIGPLCRLPSSQVCFVDMSDGFWSYGIRQYF